jgi:CSLREA domain-containing protein
MSLQWLLVRSVLALFTLLIVPLADWPTGTLTAHAATFTVTSTADAPDASAGDGVCLSTAGECTLRAAMEQANASGDPDTINVPGGTYALTAGTLTLTTDATITGSGAATTIVDGGAGAGCSGSPCPASSRPTPSTSRG